MRTIHLLGLAMCGLISLTNTVPAEAALERPLLPRFAQGAANQEKILSYSNGYSTGRLLVPQDDTFDFCADATPSPDISGAFGFNLTNAKWLAFFAANEYAHYARLAPALEALGFGPVGAGQVWRERAVFIQLLRFLDDLLDARFADRLLADFGPDVLLELDAFAESLRQTNQYKSAGQQEKAWLRTPVAGDELQFFTSGKLSSAEYFRDGSTQFVWAKHRTLNVVVVAFRGTQQRRDIAVDLQGATQETVAGDPRWGKAHIGFLNAFDVVGDVLRRKLQFDGNDAQIWVTGHSLGAALATVAAARMMQWQDAGTLAALDLRGMYTFGSPRVGNPQFAKTFTETAERGDMSTFRIRHGDDPVTKLALHRGILGTYSHVGRLVHLNLAELGGELTFSDTPDYLPEYIDDRNGGARGRRGLADVSFSIAYCLSAFNWSECIDHHSMDARYYERIEHHRSSGSVELASLRTCE